MPLYISDLRVVRFNESAGVRHQAISANAEEVVSFIASQKTNYTDSLKVRFEREGAFFFDLYHDSAAYLESWVKTNKVIDFGFDGYTNVVLSILRELKPNVLLSQHAPRISRDAFREIKRIIPSIQLTVIHFGFRLEDAALEGFDVLLFGFPGFFKLYKDRPQRKELFYHYFDPEIYSTLDLCAPSESSRLGAVTFLGTSGYGRLNHTTRYEVLHSLLKQELIVAWLEEKDGLDDRGQQATVDRLLRHALRDFSGDGLAALSRRDDGIGGFVRKYLGSLGSRADWQIKAPPPALRLSELFPSRCHSAVHGLEYYRVLGQHAATVNIHADMIDGSAGNLRLFQATGMGTCLITEDAYNISDLFSENEVLIYRSSSELEDIIREGHKDPRIFSETARRGLAACHSRHSVDVRYFQLKGILSEMLD